MAAQEGHVDVVRVLLSKGANQQCTTEVSCVQYYSVKIVYFSGSTFSCEPKLQFQRYCYIAALNILPK